VRSRSGLRPAGPRAVAGSSWASSSRYRRVDGSYSKAAAV
jgi:hypothetical protein